MSYMQTDTRMKDVSLGLMALSTIAGITMGNMPAFDINYNWSIPDYGSQNNTALNTSDLHTGNGMFPISWILDYLFHRFSSVTGEARNYINQHGELIYPLLEAHKEIQKYFPGIPVIIDGNYDEEGLIRGVYLGIETNLSFEESMKRLDLLDENWIVPHIAELRKVLIDLEFK